MGGAEPNALEKSNMATSVCFPGSKFLQRSYRVMIVEFHREILI